MTADDFVVENCPNCGNIYRRTTWPLCQSCKQEMEEDLLKCAEATHKNRRITLKELSIQARVSEARIIKYIKDNKLFIGDLPNVSYPCDLCADGIRKGNLCIKCSVKINKEIEKMNYEEQQQKEREKTALKAAFMINDRLNK